MVRIRIGLPLHATAHRDLSGASRQLPLKGEPWVGFAQNTFPLYSAAAFSQPFLTMQRAASAAWDMAS